MYAAGPAYALAGIVIVPIVLSLPLSLICSEMSSIFPQTGSTIMWAMDIVHGVETNLNETEECFKINDSSDETTSHTTEYASPAQRKRMRRELAFSKFVARLSANTLLLKAVVDNAMYPSMFCDYLKVLVPDLDEWYWRIGVSFLSFVLVAVLNFYGIDVVGWTQYVFAAIVLTPALLFVVLSFPEWDFSKLSTSIRPKEMRLDLLLSNIIWQVTGFD